VRYYISKEFKQEFIFNFFFGDDCPQLLCPEAFVICFPSSCYCGVLTAGGFVAGARLEAAVPRLPPSAFSPPEPCTVLRLILTLVQHSLVRRVLTALVIFNPVVDGDLLLIENTVKIRTVYLWWHV